MTLSDIADRTFSWSIEQVQLIKNNHFDREKQSVTGIKMTVDNEDSAFDDENVNFLPAFLW